MIIFVWSAHAKYNVKIPGVLRETGFTPSLLSSIVTYFTLATDCHGIFACCGLAYSNYFINIPTVVVVICCMFQNVFL